ncbi:MAG: UvrD-helicase domain-containing protein [Bacteroidales bacterium]|nr:UvrD-helicase domain-containing protein [Bacteroidales bacterium]
MKEVEHILNELNTAQQEAVQCIDGPLMVIAGAGSGKTRVLTYRIAYMLTQGIDPFRILALTFTNKAAAEMKERIYKLVGGTNAKSVIMGTFHSVFYRILRAEGDKLGYTHNLTVYDTDDSKSVLRSIIKEMNLDPKVYVVNTVLSRISSAKSSLLSAQEYAANNEITQIDAANGRPHISEIFLRYNQRLKNSDAMDFDDLLYYMNVLLRDFPEVLYKYQNRFQYILVDEYQDTNYAQYMIIKKLAAAHQNICVVGDDAQSIYAFRGANIQNILNFKRDYPTARVVKLEQNYRSTQNIVNAANAIIKNNKDQLFKEVWTSNEEGERISVVQSGSDNEEAQFIANTISDYKVNYHVDNNQFAILYRTNAQSRALEEALIKRRIPYKIYAGVSFYKRKEIKDMLAYFRLAINHYDEESLRRVINYPQRGIGLTTVEKVIICARERKVHLWDVVDNPDAYQLDVNTAAKAKLQEFATKIKSYTAMLQTSNAYDLGKHIAFNSGLIEELKSDPTEKERLENVEELLDSMKEFTEKEPETSFNEETGEIITEYFPSLDRYVENVALLIDDDQEKEKDLDAVKLMTIHAAKGLEFDYVFLSGMEENLFPSSLALNTRQELEEERRLFYVAITRAKKKLILTHCKTRYKFGSLQFCEPSQFLDEIPECYIKTTKKASAGRGAFAQQRQGGLFSKSYSTTPTTTNLKPVASAQPKPKVIENPLAAQVGRPATPDDIEEDIRVYHSKFGYGMVISTEGEGLEKKAIINFDTVGTKTLLLKFAKLILPN